MSLTLEHADGTVLIEELPNGRRLLAVTLRENELFIPKSRWETSYPVSLIRLILEVKGPAWLCDEIMRRSPLVRPKASGNRSLCVFQRS